ncbi:abnormal long morphology protein 1, partial [Etheostoma spectabile]|uniref:abnormal long morphology protein 1 n=1 Tax=Etheostoma spectabile TaxID=54343 RepID=UPI0013AEB295
MKDHYFTQNYNRYSDQEFRNQHTLYSNNDKRILTQEAVQRKQYMSIQQAFETQSLQPTEAKTQFEQNVHKTSLYNPDNASATTIANQVKDRKFVEVKAEQLMAEHIKAHTQAELAKAQHWAQMEQPKAESARLILAGQTGSDKVKAEEAKAELTEYQRVNQAKAENIKEDKRKEEQSREKQPECAREEQIKAAQSRVKVTEEPRNITEEVGARHLREEQGEWVKVKQAEAKRLKEEHMKTELAKAEQAKQDCLERAKHEHPSRVQINAERIEEEWVRADQNERDQMEVDQIRTEKVKSDQAEAEHTEAKQAKLEHTQEQQTKAEQENTDGAEGEKVKANHIQVEDINQEKAEDDSIQAGRVNAVQPVTQISKAKERKTELAQLEQTKVELAKAELTKTENMPDRSAKPAAKLIGTQQVENEPDKLEHVKTELAKAKAELAKIKEKMKGEQKEKVRNRVLTTEDGIKTDVPMKGNINKKEECKDQDQATQMHKQGEDSVVVSKQNSDQVSRGAEYERLREKYGFIDSNLPNRDKVLNDANETSALSLDKVETTNNEKSEGNSSPTSRVARDNTENKEGVGSFKPIELTESQYVYSESSKEFKLSDSNYFSINVDKRENSDTVSDKVKDDNVEMFDPLKQTGISHQRDSDLAKPPPLVRKPRSSEHSLGPGKDTPFTPPRALFHKERAQTKQEILTSKIKAHAEKEISAIKEKGFAVRDGFTSKTSNKQLAGNNIRQRPPSQEVSKKHESTMASNITLKHQMEPSGIQMEPGKFVPLPSSATIPVKSAATTSQFHSQKQLHKEPTKSNDNLPKPREAKQMESFIMSTDDGLVENQRKENQFGIESRTQSKEQALKNKPETKEADKGTILGKQKEGLKDNLVVNTDHLNKKKQDSPQATALVEAESSKAMPIEKTESKHEAVHEDSAPSLSLAFGQNETIVAKDKLQIMGILVTVRERKPSVDNGQRNNNPQEQMIVKEKECSNSELDECHPSSGLEVGKGNTSSKEVSMVKQNYEVVQNTHSTEKLTVKRTNLQQESSSINVRPQMITQLKEPLAEKGVPCTNKELSETNPLLYNQDRITKETKDNRNEIPEENSVKIIKKVEAKSNTEGKNPSHADENCIAKVVNTAISNTNDSNRAAAETLVKHDIQPLVKEDMTTGIYPSKSRDIDSKSTPVEEKRCDSTPSKPFNKIIPSNHLTENENAHVSPQHCYKETHIGENDQWDDDLHIGSIAIRVVPAVTEKDNLKMAGKHHVNITTVPSDVAAANEHKHDASSSLGKKVNTFNNEDRTKDLNPASREKQTENNLEDKCGVQCVLSNVKKLSKSQKLSNQQNSTNTTSANTQAENGKPEKVNKSGKSADESTIRPMVGDYFQVQGVTETNIKSHNHTNAGDTSNAVSKGREITALSSNKAVISNESCNEGKNQVFVLDQSKRKSSSVSVQDENMKKKNREPDDNLASKPSDVPTECRSNKNETEAGQAGHFRKHHTENQANLTAREVQSSRNSNPTQENTVKEKPEVKPKPKERVSTIPEISAIADYARLKVIVSEEEAIKIQEFHPNKKEGFFPLIQTRHSRRPMFTADQQDFSVKEKSLPNKTEVSSKVNKEPKPLVFPITEREHKRTGMFKLGDKERQEKMILDAKANEGVLDTGSKHAQQLKASNKSPPSHLKNQGSEEQVTGTDPQRVRQVEKSIHQPNNPLMQATTSSSAVNRPRSTSVSQHLKPLDNSNPHEKLVGQVSNKEESTTTLKKDEEIENALATIGEKRTEKMRQERLATRHEEIKTQRQSRAKQFEEEQASRIEEEKRAEEMRVRHMIEENRASVAEEERRAAQREEERRAREREAIAIKIKEKREKQREAERRAVEERAAQKEEEMKANQREEEKRMKEIMEKRRIQIEEARKAKLREEEEQIKENEEKRRVKQLEEERAAEEEMQRKAAEEEMQR